MHRYLSNVAFTVRGQILLTVMRSRPPKGTF